MKISREKHTSLYWLTEARFDPRQTSLFGSEHEAELREAAGSPVYPRTPIAVGTKEPTGENDS